jgi:uncharacterized protein DUF5060/uncharacterized protein DUF4038
MSGRRTKILFLSILVHTLILGNGLGVSKTVVKVPRYHVHEIRFQGPTYGPKDNPVREVEFVTQWQHESGSPTYQIHGFWDGDGKGGNQGNVFKVRFCPIKIGKWTLVKTESNRAELKGKQEGYQVQCVESKHPGFWLADSATGGRWYQRSDGSHPYIFGDTLYSFLSEQKNDGPTGGNIKDDVSNTSTYFNKIRFSITGDRYPHPREKPFLDDKGKPTDDGNYSQRPNPTWFHKRVDLAVQTAFDCDQIADMIVNGPDTLLSRSVLQAAKNNGDATPILKYLAARYGSFPNVWFCLANEFDIKKPKYSSSEIVRFGATMRKYLPYPTPMSVHAKPRDWYKELNDKNWHDHVIIQKKIKKLPVATDWVARNHAIGGKVPVIDDELAYEGKGDGWSEADVIESHLGAFLGGGYGTTGHKPAGKQGHYFWGNFKASEHRSADNLLWLRKVIDENITFWKMKPMGKPKDTKLGIFANVSADFRALSWKGNEYVLGSNKARSNIRVKLPDGVWQITQYNVIAKKEKTLSTKAKGTFTFDSPRSRAVLFHLTKNP